MGIFNKKIGLALGSGGARGLAHIGVLKELEKNNIQIDYISGTSIGALIGAIYAVNKSTKLLEELAASIDKKEFNKMFSDYSLDGGLVKGESLFKIIEAYIPEDMLIQDTLIPLNLVTSDLQTGERFVIKEGNLRKAIRASISIPLLFQPVEWNDKILVDGGITEAVPVTTAREMGADRIIGVDLYAGDFQKELDLTKNKSIQIAKRSLSIALEEIARRDLEKADVKIQLMVGKIPLETIAEDPTPYIEIGQKAVLEQIEKIKSL